MLIRTLLILLPLAGASAQSVVLTAAPQGVPQPGPATDGAYAPKAILPAGVVIPLYQSDSPEVNKARIGEPEQYNMS